ncbi:tRNA (N(6)-L-threonylcarbamoyladenosine(37)-C(2))-methylthiotransferase MtaB [Candidatus Margulisiibacteriota bacterium]
MLTIAAHTLGCKVNQYDTQKILSKFRELGFIEVPFASLADLYLINTCSVTHVAEHKSRQFAAKVLKQNPKARIIMAGCYSRLDAERVKEIPGVIGIIQDTDSLAPFDLEGLLLEFKAESSKLKAQREKGNGERSAAPPQILRSVAQNDVQTPITNQQQRTDSRLRGNDMLDSNEQSPPSGGFRGPYENTAHASTSRVRRNLVIQNGCDQYCAYCIIPYARGNPWDKPLEDVLAEAKKLASEEGAKEIILTGINLGAYGLDQKQSMSLRGGTTKQSGRGEGAITTVVKAICQIKGLLRIRLSSVEPQYWTDELLETIRNNPKICRHFHIPLQSGCDRTLQRMNRKYNTTEYACLIAKINTFFPDAAITTDVIAGFPGETEKDSEECLDFVSRQGFAHLHTFKYSVRQGTKAAEMPDKVPEKAIKARAARLQDLNGQLTIKYQDRFIGKELEVLWESFNEKSGVLSGLTGNYLRVKRKGSEENIGVIQTLLYIRDL